MYYRYARALDEKISTFNFLYTVTYTNDDLLLIHLHDSRGLLQKIAYTKLLKNGQE